MGVGAFALAMPFAVSALILAGCGSDAGGDDGGTGAAPDTDFRADIRQVGSSLRIAWSVTNTGDQPLLVLDGVPASAGATDQSGPHGAYVTGRSDGRVEISKRAFPVPEGTEGVQEHVIRASQLAPEASLEGEVMVLLPFQYHPAATVDGGGDPLPDQAETAVFCLGVVDATEEWLGASGGPDHPLLRHSPELAEAQSLLCSDPFQVTALSP